MHVNPFDAHAIPSHSRHRSIHRYHIKNHLSKCWRSVRRFKNGSFFSLLAKASKEMKKLELASRFEMMAKSKQMPHFFAMKSKRQRAASMPWNRILFACENENKHTTAAVVVVVVVYLHVCAVCCFRANTIARAHHQIPSAKGKFYQRQESIVEAAFNLFSTVVFPLSRFDKSGQYNIHETRTHAFEWQPGNLISAPFIRSLFNGMLCCVCVCLCVPMTFYDQQSVPLFVCQTKEIYFGTL